MKLSIGQKMILGLALVFTLSYVITIVVVGRSIQQNNKAIIEKDMTKHTHNLRLYLIQYMKSSDIQATKENFASYARELGTILSTKFEDRIIVYDSTGEFMFDSVNKGGTTEFDDRFNDDLFIALNNSSAYTIINDNQRFIVAASVPFIVEENLLGVIRYFYDYNYLASSTQNLFEYIHMSILVIFVIIFILGIFMARRITRPIVHLKEATHMIARGNFDHELTIRTNDELSELADNFNIMKEEIKERIEEIEVERDNLIRLHKHRKLFFDNVTHELKTPLTIISGYTQILQAYENKDEEYLKKTLGRIKGETDRMHAMILDLLNAAKAESDMDYHFKVFNLSELMSTIIEGTEAKNQDVVDISHHIEENIIINGDCARMRQAIENVIDNAIKYSKNKNPRKVHINTYKDDQHGYIQIKDNGIGIEEEHLKHLFKPFYRVDKTLRESSGLGLYIVRSIIQRHGGSIKVESIVHEGTQVNITIPLKFTTCLQVD